MRAGGWLQGYTRHTRDLGEVLLQLIEQLNNTLGSRLWLQWMHMSKARQDGHIFIDLGIVFHGTGTKWIETGINAKVALGKVGIVTHHLDLASLSTRGSLFAQHIGYHHIFY